MSRVRIPRGEVLQAAYGVLDKYKMNRSYFVRSDQENCDTLPPIQEAVDPVADSSAGKNNEKTEASSTTETSTEQVGSSSTEASV